MATVFWLLLLLLLPKAEAGPGKAEEEVALAVVVVVLLLLLLLSLLAWREGGSGVVVGAEASLAAALVLNLPIGGRSGRERADPQNPPKGLA